MDSSDMDVDTTGDVEAHQHHPNWFVNHKHMLRLNQEGEANKLGYFILKVPEYKRRPPQDFSPQECQFGLHNRENLDNNELEVVKLGIAIQYGLVGNKWDQFCDAIVDDPRSMVACYGLQNGVTNWTDEQIKHVLALDALFLATYMDLGLPENQRQLWKGTTVPFRFDENNVFYARFNNWWGIVYHNLRLVENQIPLVLIDKVVDYISNSISSTTSEGIESVIVDLQYQQRSVEWAVKALTCCFMDITSEAFKIDNSSPFGGKTHILGAAYNAICGSKGSLMKKAWKSVYIHVPSATKLKLSRINLVGVDGPLCTVSYMNQSLCLPKMVIYDETISFIRNMAWYELKTISGGCLFNDYISLMTDLIQDPEDLDLLIKCGVVYNACGIKGFKMWIALREGLDEIGSTEIHHDIKVAIVSRCDHRRYRLWSEFKIVFCSKPWLVLSTIAVILVTMATLVQTYVAVIGSYKMKPKFP